jgi:hypothetical protein
MVKLSENWCESSEPTCSGMISASPDGNRGNTHQIADAGKTTHYSLLRRLRGRVSACPFADNLEVAMPMSTTLTVRFSGAPSDSCSMANVVRHAEPTESCPKSKNLERCGEGEIRLNTSPR